MVQLILLSLTSQDPLWGPDKVKHAGISMVMVGSLYCLGLSQGYDRPGACVGASISVGLGKEIWDLKTKGRFSLKDLAWDLVGVGLGAVLITRVRDQDHK